MNARTRMLVVGVIVPLVIAGAAVVMMLLALPTLPDPVAVHWGPSGQPDRFGTPIGFLILVPVAVLAYSALAFAVTRGSGRWSGSGRLILATAPFLATVLGVLGAGGLQIQRGLADAHQSPSILPLVVSGFGAGILLALAAWFVLPAAEPAPELAEPSTLPLGPDERAAWTRRLEPARWLGTLLVVVGGVVLIGGGITVWLAAPLPALIAYLAVIGLIAAASVGSLFWTVSIDSRGVVARSVLGVPRFTVPLDDVGAAASVPSGALGGFGGFGLRWGGPGRIGIILGSGTALEVRRKSGGALVITTADSERAAALLNTLARRA